MQHGLQGRPVLSVVAARPRRGRRDDRDGRYASTTRHTRMESVLAAKGGNTMVRKVIIALAAVTFVGAVAAAAAFTPRGSVAAFAAE